MGEMVSELGDGCVIAVKEDGGVYNGVAQVMGREVGRACDTDLDALTDYLETCAAAYA